MGKDRLPRNGDNRLQRLSRVGKGQRFHWKIELPPGIQASGQGPDATDPLATKPQRHLGSRHLVGAIAIQDDFLVSRNLLMAVLEFLSGQTQRRRNRIGIRVNVNAPP